MCYKKELEPWNRGKLQAVYAQSHNTTTTTAYNRRVEFEKTIANSKPLCYS